MIYVYNRHTEQHYGPNVYDITRPSILSNPYTHMDLDKTKALYHVNDRDEAIQQYSHYYDIMYNGNLKFKAVIDEIYEKFKNGEDVYLGCVCKPLPCHGDIIVSKLTKRLIKEKFVKKLKK